MRPNEMNTYWTLKESSVLERNEGIGKWIQKPILHLFLTFVFPCIVSVITIGNQKDAAILIYSILISCTCLGRCFRLSSGAYHCNYIFWYCPPMLLLAGVAFTQDPARKLSANL